MSPQSFICFPRSSGFSWLITAPGGVNSSPLLYMWYPMKDVEIGEAAAKAMPEGSDSCRHQE